MHSALPVRLFLEINRMGNDRLAIIIPGRNEMYMQKTVDLALERATGDIEIIAILDGYEKKFCKNNGLPWPMRLDQEDSPHLRGDPRVTVIRHDKPIGQRASTNEGARATDAKWFMKADAHVLFKEGFDEELKRCCEPDWTVIPQMYILNCAKETLVCPTCDNPIGDFWDSKDKKRYKHYCAKCCQPRDPDKCVMKQNSNYWIPKWHKKIDWMYLANEDNDVPRVRYWYKRKHKHRELAPGIYELMTGVGACWFMDRKRFLELGGLDEDHGSWGQVGCEVACKAWLSGGKQVTNRNTWFAHQFRGNDPGFPYTNKLTDMTVARNYSANLWRNGTWPLQRRPLSWLVRHFWPVPTWNDKSVMALDKTSHRKAIIYYTDNSLDEHYPELARQVRRRLVQAADGIEIVCVSQKPLNFGDKQICVGDIGQSHLSICKQILIGIEATTADTIYLAEHDVLYSPSHFATTLHTDKKVVYNSNIWWCQYDWQKHGLFSSSASNRKLLSQAIAHRDVFIDSMKFRIAMFESGLTYPKRPRGLGEPGENDAVLVEKVIEQSRAKGIDPAPFSNSKQYEHDMYKATYPNIDIRHRHNFTGLRYSRHDETRILPYWGTLKQAIEDDEAPGRVLWDTDWYQVGYVAGTPTPASTRRKLKSSFYGRGKWDTFIAPLLPEIDEQSVFIEAGCNAGLHLIYAKQAGFGRVVGFEPDETYLRQAQYVVSAEKHDDIRLANMGVGGPEFDWEQLPCSDVTLLSCTTYFIDQATLEAYVQELAHRTVRCIIVSRNKHRKNYTSKATPEAIRSLFKSEDWQEVGSVESLPVAQDKQGKKLYSIAFESRYVRKVATQEIFEANRFHTSKVHTKLARKAARKGIDGIAITKEDQKEAHKGTRGRRLCRPRKVSILAADMAANGQKTPITIRTEDSKIIRGNHRTIIAEYLGFQGLFVEMIQPAVFSVSAEEWQRGSKVTMVHYRKKIAAADPVKHEAFDPKSVLQPVFAGCLSPGQTKLEILDVGAGPWTTINKKHPGVEVAIEAIDAKADRFLPTLVKANKLPPVPTRQMFAEHLTEHYAEGQFDITHVQNALDHTIEPLRVLQNMVAVTKSGGHIIICGYINEASRSSGGLHKWNMYLEDDALWIKHSFGKPMDISKSLSEVAKQVSQTLSHGPKGRPIITVIFQKHQGAQSNGQDDAA